MNILQISFAVFFISALVFRSISAGLIVLTPLLFSILAIFGVMGWLDIPLNIPNSLISAMAVGIGADYAIYFLYRLREILREEGGDIKDAIRKTLSTAGKASLLSRLRLLVGMAYCPYHKAFTSINGSQCLL